MVYRITMILTAVLLSLMGETSLQAAAPQLITYQGRLADGSGDAAPDGSYQMTFAIFDQPVGGILVWTETQPAVGVQDGLFSAAMGSIVPLPDTVFREEGRYLEVSANGQVLGPRTQFSSVGYAHRISTVDGATAGSLSGSLRLVPDEFAADGNAMVVVNDAGQTVMSFTVDESGLASVGLFDPVDSKSGQAGDARKVIDMSVGIDGRPAISLFDPVDSKGAPFDTPARRSIDVAVGLDGRAAISFYDPIDAIDGLDSLPRRKVVMHHDGIVMFGATEADTSLFVAPNGDIIGQGQITMGENSSSGENTAVLGFNNDASGDSSSIGGGSANVTSGVISTIGGGHLNQAAGVGATIGGGSTNAANDDFSTVAGGFENVADGAFSSIGGGTVNSTGGLYATVPGGDSNHAGGDHSYAAGHRAKADHVGSFVWADHTEADFSSTADDQFIIRATGGVGIGTNNPTGALEVVAPGGDASVILPNGAIGSSETADEPGLSAFRSAAEISLDKNSGVMEDLAVTTITIPTDGYVIVRGGASVGMRGSYGRNLCRVQIDQATGGLAQSPYFVEVGTSHDDDLALITDNSRKFYAVSTERIYTLPAGTYEFRMEGMAHPDNSGGAVTEVLRPYLTAMFIPTAYGTVTQ